MKIAVIGAGNVGGALGTLWAAKGHEIVFGVRDPQDAKLQKLLESTHGKARAASNLVCSPDKLRLSGPPKSLSRKATWATNQEPENAALLAIVAPRFRLIGTTVQFSRHSMLQRTAAPEKLPTAKNQ